LLPIHLAGNKQQDHSELLCPLRFQALFYVFIDSLLRKCWAIFSFYLIFTLFTT
jgi:hypothetical protein